MNLSNLRARIHGRYQRSVSSLLFRRPVAIRNTVPLISFTFDDFPSSALLTGGSILERYAVAGTYYASLGLMGKPSPVGTIFSPEQLEQLLARGHELGCHTFAHCHSWETRPSAFEESIIENRRAIGRLLPGMAFKTFSYPIACPRPQSKRSTAKYFACCRGGGQRFNAGTMDLNQLSAYFLEKSRDFPEAVRNMIEQNRRARGWLIFATHDVCDSPTPYGCTPGFFEDIVQCAVASGARILSVAQALDVVCASNAPAIRAGNQTGTPG